LNLLDLAIQEQRPLSKDYDIRHLQDIRSNIIYLISNELKKKLENSSVNRNIIPNFVRKIESDRANSTIISFNYDLLIDNGLLQTGLGHVNYGFKVRGLLDQDNSFNFRAIDDYGERLTPLYKLHGSANWLYCPTCNAIDLTEGIKAAYYIFKNNYNKLKICRICHTKYEPLLITPSMIKRYDNHFVRQIWSSAEESIRRADELVFIGYSLSNADYYIKYIINRAVALNKNKNKNDGQLKVLVVTRQNAGEGNETEKRYCRFFGDKVDFYRKGFERYVNSIT
jgi:NAD-dependent SIR2 family protein deacetylase